MAELETAGGEGLNLSDDELEDGVVVSSRTGKTSPAPELDEGASARAAGGEGLAPVIAWSAALGLIAAAGIGATRLLSREPRRA